MYILNSTLTQSATLNVCTSRTVHIEQLINILADSFLASMQQLSFWRVLHTLVLPPQTHDEAPIRHTIVAGGSSLFIVTVLSDRT